MIDVSFWKLPKLVVLYAWEDLKNCVAFFPHFGAEIDHATEVINAIETSHREDLAANPWLVARKEVPLAAARAFRPRDVWRVGSYVVFGTTLEGVIEQHYEGLLRTLAAHDPTWRTQQESLHAGARADREREMSAMWAARNKVYAHTAFADPRKDDTPQVQVASLQYFTGVVMRYTGHGLKHGGYHLGEHGEDSHKLPEVSMGRLIEQYPAHVAAWHRMFADVCDRVCEIPDERLKSWMPKVHTVLRKRPSDPAREAAAGAPPAPPGASTPHPPPADVP